MPQAIYADRFTLAVSQISGKRLAHAELTGKVEGSTCLIYPPSGSDSDGESGSLRFPPLFFNTGLQFSFGNLKDSL
jgi:hypothetical protein